VPRGTDISDNDGRARVVIERVSPEIDGGRFAIKRVVGERLRVEADAFVDGHDLISCAVRFGPEPAPGEPTSWSEAPMAALSNDRFFGEFTLTDLGRWRYVVIAWVDRFRSFRRDFEKRAAAGQDLAVDAESGALLLDACAARLSGADAARLAEAAWSLRDPSALPDQRVAAVLDPHVAQLMANHGERLFVTSYHRELQVIVDPLRARYGAWYELFPRSCSPVPGRHGTLRDVEARLPGIAAMGFDVLYLPPIHPIGVAHRKGRNNAVSAAPGDVGSPWAIGSADGGHKSVHPELGTLDDLRSLVATARSLGLDIALDIAFQCSPDHPYVKEHPEWFRKRSDGSIQYAENPPKKYQDIFPFDFECDAWEPLWKELVSVVMFWAEQGVSVFRVDNPHTKPFDFWEHLIGEVKARFPQTVFLAEAFTRPGPLYRLGKLGFSQSYNYFPWRNAKHELVAYFTELTRTPVKEYFRPALWPNTPDILPEHLQLGGRPAFLSRFLLAATLGATYGIYGPAFELCDAEPREPGSEEYRDSEKYEIRTWDTARGEAFRALITRVNHIRRESPALHDNASLAFHEIDNEQMLCFSKQAAGASSDSPARRGHAAHEGQEAILVVVNLDPHHKHAGWVELDLDLLGLPADQPYQVHDLLTDARFLWRGARNYVELDPQSVPAHIFRLRRRVRTERDFEYFL
jgi:starch synthase (maltosyl-transferring)